MPRTPAPPAVRLVAAPIPNATADAAEPATSGEIGAPAAGPQAQGAASSSGDDGDALFAAGPASLQVLPARDLVLFPYAVATLMVSRAVSAAAVERARGDGLLLVCLQRSPDEDDPSPEDLYPVGTVASILRVDHLTDGRLKVAVQGLRRAYVETWQSRAPSLCARLRPLEDVTTTALPRAELAAQIRQIREDLDRCARAGKVSAPDLVDVLAEAERDILREGGPADPPERLTDLIAAALQFSPEDGQRLLEERDAVQRLRTLSAHLRRELELIDLQEGIRARTREVLTRAQREHFLREQLRQIHSELDDGARDESAELRRKLHGSGVSGEPLAEAERQLRRLETLPSHSPESQIVRAHLEWLTELPWQALTDDRFDLAAARRILDEDHFGLEPIKQRMLEFLSVLRLRRSAAPRPSLHGMVLCLAGPPGVGKTSLARSVARALGRRFVRVQLGGVRDDAELRGHRRAYVGATPGRLIQGLRQAGARNPVMLLDEIDKLCADGHGDPAAALLEVLDPEQNRGFRDHYLGVPFDLSEVLFIATANDVGRIPPALRDRLELLTLSGYTDEEKLAIAARHIVPRAAAAAGLSPAFDVRLTAPALRALIRGYTREAGLRELERVAAGLMRKLAHRVVAQSDALLDARAPTPTAAEPALQPVLPGRRLIVSQTQLQRQLGPAPHVHAPLGAQVAERSPLLGRALGLAWTAAGGEVLEIETQLLPGQGRSGLTLTGQLGEVMRESAQTALSYARAEAASRGLPDPFSAQREIHVHLPAGAIPKDGPSAGVTLACALVSLLCGEPVRPGLAMTGELTLRGRVLPVGGIKEKLLAAQRAGLKTVIVPRGNERELATMPRSLRRDVRVVLVEDMSELLREALASPKEPKHTNQHARSRRRLSAL